MRPKVVTFNNSAGSFAQLREQVNLVMWLARRHGCLFGRGDQTQTWNFIPHSKEPKDVELTDAMKAKGMLPIDEILAGNLMGVFSTHKQVTDLEGLLWWVESKHESYLKMRLQYEVGGKEKDDLFEWVFAHSAVFGTIADHMRKCLPEIKSRHSMEAD